MQPHWTPCWGSFHHLERCFHGVSDSDYCGSILPSVATGALLYSISFVPPWRPIGCHNSRLLALWVAQPFDSGCHICYSTILQCWIPLHVPRLCDQSSCHARPVVHTAVLRDYSCMLLEPRRDGLQDHVDVQGITSAYSTASSISRTDRGHVYGVIHANNGHPCSNMDTYPLFECDVPVAYSRRWSPSSNGMLMPGSNKHESWMKPWDSHPTIRISGNLIFTYLPPRKHARFSTEQGVPSR